MIPTLRLDLGNCKFELMLNHTSQKPPTILRKLVESRGRLHFMVDRSGMYRLDTPRGNFQQTRINERGDRRTNKIHFLLTNAESRLSLLRKSRDE